MESPGTKLLYSVPWRMVAAVRVHVGCLQYHAGQVRVLRAPLHAPLHAPLRASASHRTRPQRVFSCALSPVAAAPPRMRYLAPRLARPPAATSRYCTLLYPRLARRSPLSTRACQRPVRSRSSSSRRWLLFHQSRVFFLFLAALLLCSLSSSQRSSVLQLRTRSSLSTIPTPPLSHSFRLNFFLGYLKGSNSCPLVLLPRFTRFFFIYPETPLRPSLVFTCLPSSHPRLLIHSSLTRLSLSFLSPLFSLEFG